MSSHILTEHEEGWGLFVIMLVFIFGLGFGGTVGYMCCGGRRRQERRREEQDAEEKTEGIADEIVAVDPIGAVNEHNQISKRQTPLFWKVEGSPKNLNLKALPCSSSVSDVYGDNGDHRNHGDYMMSNGDGIEIGNGQEMEREPGARTFVVSEQAHREMIEMVEHSLSIGLEQ